MDEMVEKPPLPARGRAGDPPRGRGGGGGGKARAGPPPRGPPPLSFLPATLLGWRPLFALREFAIVVLNSMDWHRSHGRLALYAFVVMPTHFHTIVKPAEGRTISDNLQSLGSFTAHAILKQLRESNLTEEL